MQKRYMKKYNKGKFVIVLFLLFVMVFLVACFKDNVFGALSDKTVKSFKIEGQIKWTNKVISDTEEEITAYFGALEYANRTNFKIIEFVVSQQCRIEPEYSSVRDFSSPVEFTLIAEDRTTKKIRVVAVEGTPDLNPAYSAMDTWYVAYQYNVDGANVDVYEVGEGVGIYTPWASTNQILKVIKETNLFPAADNKSAILETIENNVAFPVTGSSPTGGNVYTGTFRANDDLEYYLNRLSQPKNKEVGIPYDKRPAFVEFEYKYRPKEGVCRTMETGSNPKWAYDYNSYTALKDSFEFAVVLQQRMPAPSTTCKRLGVAWFIDGEPVSEFRKVRLPIYYDKREIVDNYAIANDNPALDISATEYDRMVGESRTIADPWSTIYAPTDKNKMDFGLGYMKFYRHDNLTSKPNGSFSYTATRLEESWGETTDPVTHIAVNAVSSHYSQFFMGAIGTELEIKNIKFIEE